jgi:CheY-like chemotaxis protein
MLRMGPLDPAVTATALETIERSAQTQAALIDDILDLSKVVTGKMSLQLDLVDLVKTVEGAIETVRLAATARRVTVEFTPPDAPAFVAGDPTRLQQIAWNLLSNAIKFSNPDTAVAVAIEQTSSTVKLIVRDAGVGIRAQFLPHVFEAFRQAEASTTRTYGGLGLGLAIVKYFAELHGGSVHAESEGHGRGATFSVSLPLVAGHSAVPREVQAVVDLRGMSVLLVEDDADTRTMIATVLHARGADVRIASSVAQACTMLEDGAVDLILTDIAMPERDGFSLVRHLQRDGNGLSKIPVIALTALGRPEDEANILAAGFRAYARKPIEPQRLTELVANIATSRGAAASAAEA